jgi:hypothetical protein
MYSKLTATADCCTIIPSRKFSYYYRNLLTKSICKILSKFDKRNVISENLCICTHIS